jgi:hypothetical protein
LAVVQKHGGFRLFGSGANLFFAPELEKFDFVGSKKRQPRAQVGENLARDANQRLRGDQ